MKNVRTVWEAREGGRWKFLASDLEELRRELGEDVLEDFLRCYVVADRMTSLVSMFHRSSENVSADSIEGKRNHTTFFFLATEALKELQLCLEGLRASLNKAGLWDADSWTKHLTLVERWGLDSTNSLIRNKAAAHVDPENIRRGLDSIQADSRQVIISEGDSGKQRDSHSRLAHDAVISGLQLSEESLKEAVSGIELFDADAHLDAELWRVLEARGLKPLLTRDSRGDY